MRSEKVSYFIPAEEVLEDKRSTAFLRALKLRIECARFINKDFKNGRLKDIGVVRTQDGWRINLYYETNSPPL